MKKILQKGFTLIELLLVMVIISAFIVMGTQYLQQQAQATRMDKTVLQLQYLLNAGLAYYVANGTWPGIADKTYKYSAAGVGGLQGTFIPDAAMASPYATFYQTSYASTGTTPPPLDAFVAEITIPGTDSYHQSLATIIAGRMPAAITKTTGTGTKISAWVNIPGSSLNGVGAVNFAGLYHQGACVPVPSCPVVNGTATIPQVFMVPVSVSGVNDQGSANNIYPISSFTAYASTPGATPDACYTGDAPADCADPGTPPASGLYWRACMQVITERGNVQETRTDAWGQDVTLAAFTRCGIPNEASGSDFTVYTH